MKRVLWWLLAGSRGGENRGRIILALRERPSNAHQLSEQLRLDYKTVRHHLKVLQDNGVLSPSGPEQYGAVYLLTPAMEQAGALFDEIWAKTGAQGKPPRDEGGDKA
ncbi:MAG: winged helix-turn-helix domain-containing protein [Halobacteriales archaeon]|nr:winged helix-turn-helix domain-containing protein [Halobacteriales archaeon]